MARDFKQSKKLDAISDLNVTPLIDLAFALLIIFMITTPVIEQYNRIELPDQSPSDQQQPKQPEDKTIVVEGSCEGQIARSPTGTGGFGYDPLFIVAERGCTMAELEKSEKNKISHRGRALAELSPRIATLIEERVAEAARLGAAEQ